MNYFTEFGRLTFLLFVAFVLLDLELKASKVDSTGTMVLLAVVGLLLYLTLGTPRKEK